MLLDRAAGLQLKVMAASATFGWTDEQEAPVKRAECWSPRQLEQAFGYLRRQIEAERS